MSRTASTGRRFRFENNLHPQSAHIAQGVDASGNKDEGAGDQGIMFGYAADDTPDLMPATLYYSHKILEQMAADRHSGAAPFLEPDAKSQVTLRYEGSKPVAAQPRSSSRPSTPRAMTKATRKPSSTLM
jgi:S-adenosylmethionine synthetase